MSQEQGSFNTMSLAQEATLINCNSQVYRQQPRKLDQQVLLSQSQVSLSKRNSTETYSKASKPSSSSTKVDEDEGSLNKAGTHSE